MEVFHDGQWGTVCDDHWGSRDADVACRQLGYPAGSRQQHIFAHFGEGTGPIWLDHLVCSGTETRLLDCLDNPGAEQIGVHDCTHNEDAGVTCDTSAALSISNTSVQEGEGAMLQFRVDAHAFPGVLRTGPGELGHPGWNRHGG